MIGRRSLLAGRLRRLERERLEAPEMIVVKCHESFSEERVAECLPRRLVVTVHVTWW